MRNYGTWFSRHPINDGLTGRAFLGARGVRYCGICSLLRSGYTMRTKCAISDAFDRDYVFA